MMKLTGEIQLLEGIQIQYWKANDMAHHPFSKLLSLETITELSQACLGTPELVNTEIVVQGTKQHTRWRHSPEQSYL